MVQAVLDALSAPQGGGDLRTRPQRYHDALAEAMRRLLASDLLPQRAGQPVKALVHIYFAELRERDQDGILQDKWIAEYRARWAAHRAANSVSTGDGGAWLEGDAAREVACRRDDHPRRHRRHRPGRGRGPDRPVRPVPPAPHPARTRRPRPGPAPRPPPPPRPARPGPTPAAARRAEPTPPPRPPTRWPRWSSRSWARSCRSSPAPAAPRRSCAATCSASPWPAPPSPSTSARPTTSRSTCAAWSRCGTRRASTPAAATSPRPAANPTTSSTASDGGRTSLTNLKDYCWWHHHVVLHELGWTLTVHPDGTSQVQAPTARSSAATAPHPAPGNHPRPEQRCEAGQE